jgi:hypothetical protein
MSGVMQVINNYVCNSTISPREILNVREDFRIPRKRIRGANANNVVSYPDSLVFALVCSLIFYNI